MLRRVQCEESDNEELADAFEVVKKLGSGSYAVVYLVREVRHELVDEEDVDYFGGRMELDEKDHERTLSGRGKRVMDRWRNEKKVMKGVMNGSSGRTRRCVYGREFAVKVLSKRNLDEDALSAQKFEVRYCVFFVHHFPRVYMRIIGYDSSVTPDSFQHCDATPNSRDPFSAPSLARIRTGRGPFLFSRAGA